MPAIISYRNPDGSIYTYLYMAAPLRIDTGLKDIQYRYLTNSDIDSLEILLADIKDDEKRDAYDLTVDNWLWYGRILEEWIFSEFQHDEWDMNPDLKSLVEWSHYNV